MIFSVGTDQAYQTFLKKALKWEDVSAVTVISKVPINR